MNLCKGLAGSSADHVHKFVNGDNLVSPQVKRPNKAIIHESDNPFYSVIHVAKLRVCLP